MELFLGHQMVHNNPILGLFSAISHHFLSYAGPLQQKDSFLSKEHNIKKVPQQTVSWASNGT